MVEVFQAFSLYNSTLLSLSDQGTEVGQSGYNDAYLKFQKIYNNNNNIPLHHG